MKKEIDVVIPSFRLDETILQGIFSLAIPDEILVNYILVADNPNVEVPASIQQLAIQGKIQLIINEQNIGFSKTRNKGINAGKADWILMLDDDIVPDPRLLFAYNDAIKKKPNSLGFIGVTDFPTPFNAVTKALFYNGAVGHFQSARHHENLSWAPTANVLLNRSLLYPRLFNPDLQFGGEDISLLTENAFANHKKYDSVPDAIVVHPWWNDGKKQWKRMFRYGKGAADIIIEPHIVPYSYRDFTNTSESVFILLIMMLVAIIVPFHKPLLISWIAIFILAECITGLVRSFQISKSLSFPIAWQMITHKNAYEAGMLYRLIQKGRHNCIGKRIDVGFSKKYPSPFRLNRWKIFKTILIGVLIAVSL